MGKLKNKQLAGFWNDNEDLLTRGKPAKKSRKKVARLNSAVSDFNELKAKEVYYFAYGSNANIEQMQKRCPLAKSLGMCTLKDYALVMRGVADVVEARNARTHGVLWKMTGICEKSLDRAEGYPYVYGKKYVTVEHNGSKVRALVYFMMHQGEQYRPCKDYYKRIEAGYTQHNICVSQLDQACDFGFKKPFENRTSLRISKYSNYRYPKTNTLNKGSYSYGGYAAV